MSYCFVCEKNVTGDKKNKCKEIGHDLDYENLVPQTFEHITIASSEQQKNSKLKTIVTKAVLEDGYVESVYINKKPYFLYSTDKGIKNVEDVIIEDKIILPVTKEKLGYDQYVIDKKNTTCSLQNLLERTKKIIDKTIVVPERDKIIILANIAISYSLEWTNSVHYVAVIGDTGSGKTSVLKVFEELMYRPLFAGNISSANVFRFLGKGEEGIGCILEDEIQTMNKDHDKISAYKIGYTRGAKIPKINMNKKEQSQDFFLTFSPKIFAGEALPKDRGLLERIVPIYMIQGTPELDINRPTSALKDEIGMLRGDWILYKLKHLTKPENIPDLKLSGRNAQLFEDYLILFSGTKYYKSLRDAISYYVNEREEIIHDKLEARIYRVARKIMNNNSVSMSNLWKGIQDTFVGNPQSDFSFEMEDGEIITKNSISKMLVEKFRVRRDRTSTERYFVFNNEVVKQLDDKYGKESLD